MKKILIMMLMMVSFFTFNAVFSEAAMPTYDVTVNARFDNENTSVGTGLTAQAYGTKVTLDSNLPADPGGDTYQFAFWIVNGVARYDLAQNHEFIITGDMTIEAVYSKSTEHAAIFMDTNGEVLDTQYVTNGGDAISPGNTVVSFIETFDNFPETGSTYQDGSFTGVDDILWTYTQARGDQDLTGQALTLGDTSRTPSLTATLPGGITSLSVDYYNAFSSPAGINLYINDILVDTSIEIDDKTITTYTNDTLAYSEEVTLKIEPTDGQLVLDNLTIESETNVLPTKPGYLINQTNPWNAPLTNITDDQIFILQYEIDSSSQYTVTVNNGTGDGSYTYNDEVIVTPDSLVDFSHWEINGEIVSFDETYAFTALSDVTVDAVNQNPVETETPLIVLSSDLALRTGYESYVGQFYIPDGYTLVDYGILASETDEPITLETAGITRYQGFKYNGSTNEFLMSLGTSHTLLRGYLVLDNGTDYEFFYTTYTDTVNPVISGVPASASINEGDTYDEVTGITASDNVDGDITGDIDITVTNSGDNPVTYTDFSGLAADTYTITYLVTDSSGNFIEETTTLTILEVGAAVYATDLFISEYIEGSSNNKAIEIYNGTGVAVDLSQYTVKLYANGATSPTTTATLSGTLNHGDVYVLYNSSSAQAIIDAGDTSSGVANFNGDDAIELVKGTTLIDVFGEVGSTSWASSNTSDNTLVRKATITSPNTTWDINEWDIYPSDTFSYLGSHTMDGSGSGSTDTTAPVISGVPGTLSLQESTGYDVLAGITATDDVDGNVTNAINVAVKDSSNNTITNYGDLSGLSSGQYTITYTVSDAAGNTTTETTNLSIIAVSGNNPSSPDAPTITMDANYEYVTELNATWIDYGCSATDPEDGTVACTLDNGTVDTSTVGSYLLTYSSIDSQNNTTTVNVQVDVLKDISFLSLDLDTYYDSAEGLYGEDLLLALRNIINTGFSGVSYGDSRTILDETDQDPNNANNVILVYQQTSVSGVWDNGVTWNREHVWPQSLLGVDTNNSSIHEGSDLHNLKPADPGENSSRSNRYFDIVAVGGVSYTPPAVVQGDIARILFYMEVMYDHLDLVNTDPATYEMAKLDVLIEWHYQDAVDAFESNRNDVIYTYQNNRNPFIDYEHFLELIYWDHPEVIGAE